MKAYVIGYMTKHEHYGLLEVVYGPHTDTKSRYSTPQLAERVCERLNRIGVRVGGHHCTLAIDPLPDGGFGVFCIDHPRCTKARSSIFLRPANF